VSDLHFHSRLARRNSRRHETVARLALCIARSEVDRDSDVVRAPRIHAHGEKPGAKLVELTDLQWEFFFTCWRYNLDFHRQSPRTQWMFNLGVPLYYYGLGRKLFGSPMKYPLFRLGHLPDWLLARKLYLDFRRPPKYKVPDFVEIPVHEFRPELHE